MVENNVGFSFFSSLSLSLAKNQLNSRLGLVRSYLTSISVTVDDSDTPPVKNGGTRHMSHAIRLPLSPG